MVLGKCGPRRELARYSQRLLSLVRQCGMLRCTSASDCEDEQVCAKRQHAGGAEPVGWWVVAGDDVSDADACVPELCHGACGGHDGKVLQRTKEAHESA